MAKRGRPKGSRNKNSAFVMVQLSDLVQVIAMTGKIPIKRSFAEELLKVSNDYNELEEDEEEYDEYEEVEKYEPLNIICRQRNETIDEE